MADEKKDAHAGGGGGNAMEGVWMLVGIIAVLTALWFARGAYKTSTTAQTPFISSPGAIPSVANPSPDQPTQ
jgi:hypothetical protein